ncbi:MAG: bifunctional riboflavin kinase/FAD synthetase [Leptolyngbya sp. SIO4C1]|nr:bifunctional riboflavin kinase/FAD synthetase [Leptolyngbya sp. SIO4C1]
MWITSSLTTARKPARIALGNFDGVHLGHQRVIEPVLLHKGGLPDMSIQMAESVARCLSRSTVASGYSDRIAPWESGWHSAQVQTATLDEYATVVTFFPHPREYFSGQSRPLLTPLEEKTLQLAHIGVDQLVLLPFNQALSKLSAEDFVEQILICGLQARHISIGSDFHFGRGRTGNAELLSAISAQHGVSVTVVPLQLDEQARISSSRIRQALSEGRPTEAARLLGRPYTLTGRVVPGQQLGRKIGFPTANLKLPSDKFIPSKGVYSVKVYGAIDDAQAAPLPGVVNIGTRPTVAGQALSVEVHLLDWAGDLYGKTLTISLEAFLRAEQKFDSLDSLKAQIERDCQAAKERC